MDIPLDIERGLANGSLTRYGGVIRDQSGRIVTFLQECKPVPEKRSSSVQRILSLAKKNKYILIFGTVVCAIGGITYLIVKNNDGNQKMKIPKCLADFDMSFAEYVDAIKNGKISISVINNVIYALEDIKTNREAGNLDIIFSDEKVDCIMSMLRDYTEKLAATNAIEFIESETNSDDIILNMEQYLKQQNSICSACL